MCVAVFDGGVARGKRRREWRRSGRRRKGVSMVGGWVGRRCVWQVSMERWREGGEKEDGVVGERGEEGFQWFGAG